MNAYLNHPGEENLPSRDHAEQFADKGGWGVDTQFIETMGSPYLIAHGLGTAIAAARLGAKVALVHNRAVLGGNGSSEIRVWAMGSYPPSEYPLDEIIREIEDKAKASPAPAEEFVDDKKEKVVRAEKNITLFLSHHAYGLAMKDGKIAAVKAVDIEGGKLKRINGRLFADCTGHGFIGLWAGADTVMTEKGRMGMSNMWIWENQAQPVRFPEEKYVKALPEHPFISRAVHGGGVNKAVGYPIPYRTLYSRNVPNLFMAGRNISVNRDALGTTRVMKTIGMMGVTIGRAAALATARDCLPREIYTEHLAAAKTLWRKPGKDRVENIDELRKNLDTTPSTPAP